ncbi:MAG: ABC transporter ATP-binding protein [Deltaproteobacteria bacterium]|jgi:branched-chain amino acid transport system ATP-binding protein|nr:ABC transporter ATP-binding protein [Deltaproteobacteria bacterium]
MAIEEKTAVAQPILELKNLVVSYGGVEAVHGLSLSVAEGELVTILGANGAGKSTTLMAISGLVPPSGGEIYFKGQRIDVLRSHEVVKLGVTQAPEGRRVFGPMTVEENLKLGAFTRAGQNLEPDLARVYGLFPRLEERAKQMAGTLSGGEQQMLAIGRALMARPTLLLLDEPSLGLAPLLVKSIFQTIKDINQSGVTIILVEQNARAALKLADRGYVLDVGYLVLEDRAERLLDNPQVRDAYLGAR